MENFGENLLPALQQRLPSLLMALGILIVGWLVALAIAALVRAVLRRTSLDNKIAGWFSAGSDKPVDIEQIVSRIVFWVLMLMVLVAFFQALGMTLVTEPLNSFLNQIFTFLPRLISAAVLMLIAWLVASGLRFAVRKVMNQFDVDRRLGDSVRDPEPENLDATIAIGTPPATAPRADAAARDPLAPPPRPSTATKPVSQTVAETVYWLVFLLFLPAILDALALEGLMAPVVNLLDEVMAFLPNLLAAALILVVGWFVAKIIRRIVTNLLAAAGADRLAVRVGVDRALGTKTLSGVIGVVVYVLVLVPVLVSALNALDLEAVTTPASEMLNQLLAAIPNIFAAALVLILAFIVGKIVAGLASNLLQAVGFDRALSKVGFGSQATTESRKPSEIAGTIVLVAIMLFATIEALELLGFGALSILVASLTVFLGKVILALAILWLGLYLGNLAAETVRSSATSQSNLLATVARAAIVVLAGFMALEQVGVAESIINLAFGLLLGAVAVAAAIAFGIGGRDQASRYLSRWLSKAEAGAGTPPAASPPSPPPAEPSPR